MGKSTEITICGVKYKSIRDAAIKNNLSMNTLFSRLENGVEEQKLLSPPRSHAINICGIRYESVADAANKNGLHPQLLAERISRGVPEDKLLLQPWGLNRIEINGTIYNSLNDASRQTGIPASTLKRRLENGYEGKDVISPVRHKPIRTSIHGKEYKSCTEAAKNLGISRAKLNKQLGATKKKRKKASSNGKKNSREVIINGDKYDNYADAARKNGISPETLSSRRRNRPESEWLEPIHTAFVYHGTRYNSFIDFSEKMISDPLSRESFINKIRSIRGKHPEMSKEEAVDVAMERISETGSHYAGEIAVQKELERRGFCYKREVKLKRLLPRLDGLESGEWRMDFVIYRDVHPSFCIEYDGAQHFYKCNWIDDNGFVEKAKRDKLKSDYIRKELGIPLLRIKYTQNPSKVIDAFLGNVSINRINPFLSIEEYWKDVPLNIDDYKQIVEKRKSDKYAKRIDHLGNTYRSLKEMCAAWGMSESYFRKRANEGNTTEEILTNAPSYPSKKIECNGITYQSIVSLLQDEGANPDHITRTTLNQRLKKGFSIEEAMSNQKCLGVVGPDGVYYRYEKDLFTAFGVSASRIRRIMEREKLEITEAVLYAANNPAKNEKKKIVGPNGKEYPSIRQLISAYGLNNSTVHRYAKRNNMTINEAINSILSNEAKSA